MTKIIDSKTDVLGIYAVKSPYHENTHYLPFIILRYVKDDNAYSVLTVEYKGLTAYQVDDDYSEKIIHEFIEKGVIAKKATVDSFKDDHEAKKLVRQYFTAKNQTT